jgi:hypothetical protein
LEKVAQIYKNKPDHVWLTGNFLIELAGNKAVIPQTQLLRINPETAISFMIFIFYENSFMKREIVQRYGGFNEGKNAVVEFSLWLNILKDYRPLIIDDEYTVFIIHKGSTSTGSFLKFSMAVMRAFSTQRKENAFPLIGHYTDKSFTPD